MLLFEKKVPDSSSNISYPMNATICVPHGFFNNSKAQFNFHLPLNQPDLQHLAPILLVPNPLNPSNQSISLRNEPIINQEQPLFSEIDNCCIQLF